MKAMQPAEAYRLHLAVKLHFTKETYNFAKHEGRVANATAKVFQAKTFHKFFNVVVKRYTEVELLDLFVANISQGRTFIDDIMTDEGHDCFLAFRKRTQSLAYTFSEEMTDIGTQGSLGTLLEVRKGMVPGLLTLHLSGRICIETMSVLNDLVKVVPYWDRRLGKDDVIWGRARLPCLKMGTFLNFDRAKMVAIVKDITNPQYPS